MAQKTIGAIAHTSKPGAPAVLSGLLQAFTKRGAQLLLDSESARLIGETGGRAPAELAARCDLLLILGGDGTLLRVVHELGSALPPLLGVNIGSLGFLTTASSLDLDRTAGRILAGDYTLSARTLLEAALWSDERETARFFALNDCVISRGVSPNLARAALWVDGLFLTEFNADGVIIATPTGSTAYSLSAGGPIVHPGAGVFVVTPICPHVLTNRSLILPDSGVLELRPSLPEGGRVLLSADGREPVEMRGGDRLVISRAANVIRLASMAGVTFFDVLRDKLKWAGSSI